MCYCTRNCSLYGTRGVSYRYLFLSSHAVHAENVRFRSFSAGPWSKLPPYILDIMCSWIALSCAYVTVLFLMWFLRAFLHFSDFATLPVRLLFHSQYYTSTYGRVPYSEPTARGTSCFYSNNITFHLRTIQQQIP